MKILICVAAIAAYLVTAQSNASDKTNEAQLTSRITVDGAQLGQERNYQVAPSSYNLPVDQTEPYDITFNYHNYDKMTKFLRHTTSKYPSLTALYSIGKSVQGM